MENTLKEIIKVIKSNCDNDLTLLKMLIELKAKVEKLEQKQRGDNAL